MAAAVPPGADPGRPPATASRRPAPGSRASRLPLDSSGDSDRFRGDDESDCDILPKSPHILRTQDFALHVDHVDAAERGRVEYSYEMDVYGIK